MNSLFQYLADPKGQSPIVIEGQETEAQVLHLAQLCLCEQKSACGECRACKKVKKGFHPDWIDLAGPYKIEELREALYKLKQRPFEAHQRLFTLRHFDTANVFVQNALLKTFEEPSPRWRILVFVNSVKSLLPTLRSRSLLWRNREPHTKISIEGAQIFAQIQNSKDLEVYQDLELILKERVAAKEFLMELLHEASRQSYPGRWRTLAPALEKRIDLIDRNLNPKLIWEASLAEAAL